MKRAYWLEIKTEFLKLARMKTYSVSTVLFPLMFYCFFGLAMGGQGPHQPRMARLLLATYGAFAVMGATLYAFGIGVAVERGLGWLELKRASPMPPPAYFAAKAVVSMAFGALVVLILFCLGAAAGGVRMPAERWAGMGAALVAGSLPFCALGLAIGNVAGANSAPALVNMVHLPLGFLGGLWMPYEMLPGSIQRISPWLPSYHLGQLALNIQRGPAGGPLAPHCEALAAFALLFIGVAWLAQARESEKNYG